MNYATGGFSTKDTGTLFRVVHYGCGSGQIVEQLKNRSVEASGRGVFYEGGSCSKSVPPQLHRERHSARRLTDCGSAGQCGCTDPALDRLTADTALRVQCAARR